MNTKNNFEIYIFLNRKKSKYLGAHWCIHGHSTPIKKLFATISALQVNFISALKSPLSQRA
jgi:hypothetical protein